MDVPTAVYVIWWVMLIVSVLVVLPLVVYLLNRALNAARQIERYAARALEAGGGIAGNTASVAALEQTIEGAGGILATARDIEEHTGTIERVLADRVERASR